MTIDSLIKSEKAKEITIDKPTADLVDDSLKGLGPQRPETVEVMELGTGRKVKIAALWYHTTKKPGPVEGGRDNVIWLASKPIGENEGARTFVFDLRDPNCPIKIKNVIARVTRGYMGKHDAEDYALEGIDGIYDFTKVEGEGQGWIAYFGHKKPENKDIVIQ